MSRIVIVTGLAAALAVAPVAVPRAAASTGVVAVSPVGDNGALRPGLHVTRQIGGATCQAGSMLTGTAYRCFTPRSRQSIFDPCWATSDADYVICQAKPWTHKVVRLHVTGGYEDSDGFHHVGKPWGVGLASGYPCLRDVAATTAIDGHPVTYSCRHRIVLTGTIDRGDSTWRARAYRYVGPRTHRHWRPLGRQRITTAWKGAPSRIANS